MFKANHIQGWVFVMCSNNHTLLIQLQCISEPYSKHVVNTFFWTNISLPWVTTLQATSFKLFASCENVPIQYHTSLLTLSIFSQGAATWLKWQHWHVLYYFGPYFNVFRLQEVCTLWLRRSRSRAFAPQNTVKTLFLQYTWIKHPKTALWVLQILAL